jgi:hypothetical protein
MKLFALIALIACPISLSAEVAEFEQGQFLTITARYEGSTGLFLRDVPKGERGACFRVDDVTAEGLTLSLIKGTYSPDWAGDTPYKAGEYTDRWFTSDTFRDKHPNATKTEELAGIFTAHATCP